MTTLPRTAEMYRALVERDASYDGLFFVGVKTTGIFCRPICPAKKPRSENVSYFVAAHAAERAGFRACKRCRPLEAIGSHPRWVVQLLREVETRSRSKRERMKDDDVRAAGFEPVNARRYFKEHFGMTFHAYQRTLWLADAPAEIESGRTTSDVALDSGFESESGFRAAFTRLFGTAPSRSSGGRTISAALLTTPIGPFVAAAFPDRVCMLDFPDRAAILTQTKSLRRWFDDPILPGTNDALEQLREELAEYFAGKRKRFDVKLALAGTPFQESVWKALLAIPYGETRSYEDIARAIGNPKAVRAVGKANGDNRMAILIPCHRVVEKGGALRGYAGGLWRKQRLLELEEEHSPSR
ncbi:MAG: methylated-DNA--[protein]-cysteine S-methyltransferase [Planctomycetota bacterium]|nr:methylated-DNA--[protein]-cysteine S-methyltransferase [Planctomycetota bacterium]